MNCDEYLAILAATSADEVRPERLPGHGATCLHCQRATRLVMERERSFAGLDGSLHSQVPAVGIPTPALVAHRHRLVKRLYLAGLAIIVAGSVGFWVSKRLVVNPTALDALAERAFLVQCMSAEEAAAIARPLLGLNGLMTYRGDPGRGVVTIRGTPAQIREVSAALDHAEQRGLRACKVGTAVPVP